MMITPDFIHYAGIGAAIGLSTFGTGLGQGIAANGALNAMIRQQLGVEPISRALTIGLAFIEGGAILALVMAILLLTGAPVPMTDAIAIAHLGIGICIGLVTASMAIASSCAVRAACHSMARHPFFAQKILSFMLIIQSFIETPVVFAFIVTLIINAQIHPTITWHEGLKLLIAGLTVAVGSVGPAIAQTMFGTASCTAIGLDRESYGRIFSFSLLSQAIIETPVIFVLISTLFIVFKPLSPVESFTTLLSLLAAAITISIGTAGASIGTSYVASRSSRMIALHPDMYSRIFRTTFIAQAVIESCGIYALVVGLLMIIRA